MKTTQAFLMLCTITLVLSCTRKKNPLPHDSDEINFKKSEAMVDENFMRRWEFLLPQEGSKAKDFTLEDQNGKAFNLYSELKKGTPLLLINGSYTCDISRRNLTNMEELSNEFEGRLKTFLIHTVEAHPSNNISPYSLQNEIWPSNANIRDNAEAKRPTTYFERKKLTQKWRQQFDISNEILIDDVQNNFWNKYGQAPNMAFLINPDGTIEVRQIFFDKEELEAKIREVLI